MGFGTGITPRRGCACGAAGDRPARESVVLDVGTGSGVLAIAAACSARRARSGIDKRSRRDQSARENLALNPEAVDGVGFEVGDLHRPRSPAAGGRRRHGEPDRRPARSGRALALLAAVRAGGTLDPQRPAGRTSATAVVAAFARGRGRLGARGRRLGRPGAARELVRVNRAASCRAEV